MTSRPTTPRRRTTSASAGAAQIDAARRSPDAALKLVELLSERAPLYAGRGSNAIRRLRAVDDVVTFERFAATRDSTDSVTALSELASTLAHIGRRASHVLEPLTSLVENDGHRFSDAVQATLAKAIAALGQSDAATVGCCGTHADEIPATTGSASVAANADDPRQHVLLENQDGQRLTFAKAFGGRPSALAFFYTRCTNPEKCSRP